MFNKKMRNASFIFRYYWYLINNNISDTNNINFTDGISETNSNAMEKELVIPDMAMNLRYYTEGLSLTLVATIGMFGKRNYNVFKLFKDNIVVGKFSFHYYMLYL